MKRAAALLIVLVAAGLAREASAATADGTLITNVATATYAGTVAPGSTAFLGGGWSVSYGVTAWVLVSSPNIQLQKTSSPTVACSGGTVTYCIYAVNTSLTTSAFNVVLWDQMNLPTQNDFSYLGNQTSWNTTNPAAVLTKGYSMRVDPGCGTNCSGPFPYAGGNCCIYHWTTEPALYTGSATGQQIWMQWVWDKIGPGRSAAVCFQVQVN
ncbi:MAG: hypothetical protein AAB368_07820 [bacterium]